MKEKYDRQATRPGRPREVASRDINRSVEAMLWGRAAGRCEFEGCNQELYKSRVTQEPVNIAQKAHITPSAPRARAAIGEWHEGRSTTSRI